MVKCNAFVAYFVISGNDGLLELRLRRSPEHRSHSGFHLFHTQRLGDVVISPNVQPLYQIVLAVECRDEDDGNLRCRRIVLQSPSHLET